MKKIAYFGYLPSTSLNIGGGEVKTRTVLRELLDCKKYKIKTYNTANWSKKIIIFPFWILSAILFYDEIIVVSSTIQFLRILICMNLLNKITKKNIHFIPVGNCDEHIIEQRFNTVNCIRGIYVQTEINKKKLDQLGLKNVFVMHNFKRIDTFCTEYKYEQGLKYCYFSRVSDVKGIMETIDIFKRVNQIQDISCHLDIYGRVDSDIEELFYNNIKDCEFIKYMGNVNSRESSNIIKNYYMTVFPTKFMGEGFPGTIIDTFAAGVPLLTSRFNYFEDILKENVNCISFEFNNYNDMLEKLLYTVNHYDEIISMRKNCYIEYKKYLPPNEIKVLINNFGGVL